MPTQRPDEFLELLDRIERRERLRRLNKRPMSLCAQLWVALALISALAGVMWIAHLQLK